MNISAPPTSSRGNSNASRTSSLTNITALPSKTPPFHTSESRASSLKSIFDNHHASSNNTSRPSKLASGQRGSNLSLPRLLSHESVGLKQYKGDSSNEKSTAKARTTRSRSLTAESGQKLDEFINNVKQFQLTQLLTPGYQLRSPASQKVLPSNITKPLKHVNSAFETPNAKNKKRLVKQFYEDSRSSKNSSTPVRNNSLTHNELGSPITPELVTQNIFNNYDLSDTESQHPEGRDDQDLSNPIPTIKDDLEPFTIERELLRLKFEVLNEVKSKVNQTEIETLTLVNSIELKKFELVELNNQLLSKYEESKPRLSNVEEKDFSKYSLKNENIELDNRLNELESSLQKYREIINNEKSLINEIDDDLEYLEKITVEKLQRARYNRNRVAISVVVLSICYLIYCFT